MDPRVLIGINLSRLRRERAMTQEQLEDRCGVSQQYLSGLESGTRNPTIVILVKIAGALGVGVVDLLEGIDE
jgi:transcriptional regulator with XRE-family HTH domain